MDTLDRDFWNSFHDTWPDMSLVNALLHEGAPDPVIHEAMSAAREGRVPDIAPERSHDDHPGPRTRWVPSGVGAGLSAMIIRREDEPDEE